MLPGKCIQFGASGCHGPLESRGRRAGYALMAKQRSAAVGFFAEPR
jgi:hypothetical protein